MVVLRLIIISTAAADGDVESASKRGGETFPERTPGPDKNPGQRADQSHLSHPSNVRLNRSFTQSLDVHPKTINRFELQLQTVCEGDKNVGIDSHMYDSNDHKDPHPFYVYRPRYENLKSGKAVEVSQSSGIVHRYSKRCRNNVNLKDWRQTVSVDHLHFIEEVGKELKMLLV